MTKDADYAYAYDAWDNLVSIKAQNDSDVTIATYGFLADDRRASKVVTNRGDLDGTWYFSYDGQEVVEERNGSEEIVQQYVYGPSHIDEPVMIRGTHGTFFVYQDANWNVIGTTTPGGDVAEEYNYTPYGRVLVKRHTAFGDSDGDGDIDSTDQTAWAATQGVEGVYDRNFDADYDGDNDAYDQTAFDNNDNAAGESVIVANRAWSPNANDLTFTGRRLDPESMLMHYRWRAYSPTLKRFMQRDPLLYIDGPSMYEYVRGNPLRHVDPMGLGAVQQCKAIARRMANKKKEINRQRKNLRDNPLDLPEGIKGGSYRDSASGHRALLQKYIRELRELQEEYKDKDCAKRIRKDKELREQRKKDFKPGLLPSIGQYIPVPTDPKKVRRWQKTCEGVAVGAVGAAAAVCVLPAAAAAAAAVPALGGAATCAS